MASRWLGKGSNPNFWQPFTDMPAMIHQAMLRSAAQEFATTSRKLDGHCPASAPMRQEDFWPIVAIVWPGTGRADCEGDPLGRLAAIFRRGEDSGVRGEDGIAELRRREGISRKSLLSLVEGISGGRRQALWPATPARAASSDEV